MPNLRLSPIEAARFFQLKDELFGPDKFVVLDEQDPKVREYNSLLDRVLACLWKDRRR